jgi:hypothetical protein
MENAICFDSLGGFVSACNGKTNDALVLVYIIQESFNYRKGEFFPVIGEYLRKDTGISQAQLTSIFKRLASRFGIEKKMLIDKDFGCSQMHFRFDFDSVIALIELYANE